MSLWLGLLGLLLVLAGPIPPAPAQAPRAKAPAAAPANLRATQRRQAILAKYGARRVVTLRITGVAD
jgi:hypothetical protein